MNKNEYIDLAEQEILHTYNRYQVVFDYGEGVYENWILPSNTTEPTGLEL